MVQQNQKTTLSNRRYLLCSTSAMSRSTVGRISLVNSFTRRSNKETTLDASNDVFPRFEISYPKQTGMSPEELEIGFSYEIAKYSVRDSYAVAWIMDFSGSMAGEKSVQAKQQFQTWIEALDLHEQTIYCAVICFGSMAEDITNGFILLTKASRETLIANVNSQGIYGGTNMNTGFIKLREAEVAFTNKTKNSDIATSTRLEIHVTSDGQVFDAEETLQTAKRMKLAAKHLRNLNTRAEDASARSPGEEDDGEGEEDSDPVPLASLTFMQIELRAYPIGLYGDTFAKAFFERLTKVLGGYMSVPGQENIKIEDADEVKGPNLLNTLYIIVPEERRDEVTIDQARLEDRLPADFIKESLNEDSCKLILPKGQFGALRTFTVPILLNSTCEAPTPAYHFLTARLCTERPRRRRGADMERSNELSLDLVLDRTLSSKRKHRAPKTRAIRTREKVRDGVLLAQRSLQSSSSMVEARATSVEILEDTLKHATKYRKVASYSEVKVSIELIKYVLRRLRESIAEFSNAAAAALLERVNKAIDTLTLTKDLAEAIPSSTFFPPSESSNVKPKRRFLPFTSKQPLNEALQGEDKVDAEKARGVSRWMLDRVRSIVRSKKSDVDEAVNELVFRKEMRKRLKEQYIKREMCLCDPQCSCGGQEGGCLGDCSCSKGISASPSRHDSQTFRPINAERHSLNGLNVIVHSPLEWSDDDADDDSESDDEE